MRYDWNRGAIYKALENNDNVGAIVIYLAPPAGIVTVESKWHVNVKFPYFTDLER